MSLELELHLIRMHYLLSKSPQGIDFLDRLIIINLGLGLLFDCWQKTEHILKIKISYNFYDELVLSGFIC